MLSTDELAQRIQAVEHEIALEKEQRARAARRPASNSPPRVGSPALRTMRTTYYAIGGVLGLGGIGMTIAMVHEKAEWELVAIGVGFILIGAFMVMTAFRAKRLDDFGTDSD